MKDPQPTMHPIWRLFIQGAEVPLFWLYGSLPAMLFKTHLAPSLTIYTSQDQVYAEPIFKAFEETSGIRVKALYDHESVKVWGWPSDWLQKKAIRYVISSGATNH